MDFLQEKKKPLVFNTKRKRTKTTIGDNVKDEIKKKEEKLRKFIRRR